ncbi:hypothetical protein O9H85_07835 [Paenibacillus filicis]|uniref:Uncharacterized protein n=1 Tax=Paenibacillus gyeongsangnamensis TaxID=3388067 RepID=A0ABT4Q683_9BACL|nr:hypothetical protein [Paenibacillus filicis]MCZ8512341.1 hypothetical protein [Paenibacillus filicis]
MFNNKPLLYGLGSGLIAGAILLQLMNVAAAPGGKSAVPAPTLEDMDSNQIRQVASKYFVVNDKNAQIYNQKQVDDLIQQRLKEEAAKQQGSSVIRETYIYISEGQTSFQVADMLLQSGVVTDKKAFEDEMNKRKMNGKIVAGTHVFKGPADLDGVIANITSK